MPRVDKGYPRKRASSADQWGTCLICNGHFYCQRSDAQTCGTRCRRALYRICARISSGIACPSLTEQAMEYMEKREERERVKRDAGK